MLESGWKINGKKSRVLPNDVKYQGMIFIMIPRVNGMDVLRLGGGWAGRGLNGVEEVGR